MTHLSKSGGAKLLREDAARLRGAHAAAQLPQARLRLAERMRVALGRAAHIELSNLKCRYKAEGFSEPEIHGVIPDRPRAPKSAPGAPGPSPLPS